MDQVDVVLKKIDAPLLDMDMKRDKHPDQEMVAKIAGKIRAIRLMRNLTIKQLAEKAKVTKGLLSKIENSRTIPSLPVFIQILGSLNISFGEFFGDMEQGDTGRCVVIRKDQPATMVGESYGIADEDTVRRAFSAPKIEMTLFKPKGDTKKIFQVTAGFRLLHVISGACEYHVKDEIIYLGNGDSIYFDGRIPHLFVSMRDREAMTLIIDFAG